MSDPTTPPLDLAGLRRLAEACIMQWKPVTSDPADPTPSVYLLGVGSEKCQTQKDVSRRCYRSASVVIQYDGLPGLPMCAACYEASRRRDGNRTPPLHELREIEADLRAMEGAEG